MSDIVAAFTIDSNYLIVANIIQRACHHPWYWRDEGTGGFYKAEFESPPHWYKYGNQRNRDYIRSVVVRYQLEKGQPLPHEMPLALALTCEMLSSTRTHIMVHKPAEGKYARMILSNVLATLACDYLEARAAILPYMQREGLIDMVNREGGGVVFGWPPTTPGADDALAKNDETQHLRSGVENGRTATVNKSGGIDIHADTLNIYGDITGHDKTSAGSG